MLFARRSFCLSLLLLTSAAATPVDEAARALITPAPQLDRRQSSNSQTCGYINGNYRSPLACSAGSTWHYSYISDVQVFGCCGGQSCPDLYATCFGATDISTSCPYAASWQCLYCTGTTPECAFYTLFDEYEGDYSTISVSCSNHYTEVTVIPTPTNAPAKNISCIPDGFEEPHPGVSCAAPAILLIPLILSNIVVFAANILLSTKKLQSKLKFWKTSKDTDDPWRPWSGLSTVALYLLQAVISAALIRAGGYQAAWVNLILLWLMRPRMLWGVMFLYSCFGKQYKRSATDSLFADGVLNILSIPIATWFLEAFKKNASICGNSLANLYDDPYYVTFGSEHSEYLAMFGQTPIVYLSFALVDLFIFVAFLWKRQLGRGWAAGAGFWAFAEFGASWYFWVVWVIYSEGSFCVSNIGPLAAIHATFPILSAVFRAWFT